MKKEQALQEILSEWFKLPESERDTEKKAVSFAFRMLKERPDLTSFRASGDKYQIIKGFLCRYLARNV
jgi:hypothetical protein